MTREADGLQYGSRATYGAALSGCDTNAARFNTIADMQAWLTGGDTDVALTSDEIAAIASAVWTRSIKNDTTGVAQTAGDRLIGAQSQNDLDAAVAAVLAQARANGTDLSALAGTVADAATHDEIAAVLAAIASQPTGAVDVAALAIALAAELGPDLAQQVADELHNRLQS